MTDGRRGQIAQWLDEAAEHCNDLAEQLRAGFDDFEGLAVIAEDAANLVGATQMAIGEELPDDEENQEAVQ